MKAFDKRSGPFMNLLLHTPIPLGEAIRKAAQQEGITLCLWVSRQLAPIVGQELPPKDRPGYVSVRTKAKTSRYRGVSWVKGKKKSPWKAGIGIGKGKQKPLGVFATQEEAAKAYDAAARQYHGDKARLNFPS